MPQFAALDLAPGNSLGIIEKRLLDTQRPNDEFHWDPVSPADRQHGDAGTDCQWQALQTRAHQVTGADDEAEDQERGEPVIPQWPMDEGDRSRQRFL